MNTAGSDDWQEPMPTPDQGHTVLDHVRGGRPRPPASTLRPRRPGLPHCEGAWQQRKQQSSHSAPIPTNTHVAFTCGIANILGDAGNGPAVLGRPEVAVQDDLPSRRGTVALHDRTGTRIGIVVQREEHGPAEPCSRRLTIRVAGPQHGDRGVSKSLPWHCGVAAVPPMRRSRPIGLRPESTQAFTAERLDSDNGPLPIVGVNLALERPVGKSFGVVPMSPHHPVVCRNTRISLTRSRRLFTPAAGAVSMVPRAVSMVRRCPHCASSNAAGAERPNQAQRSSDFGQCSPSPYWRPSAPRSRCC